MAVGSNDLQGPVYTRFALVPLSAGGVLEKSLSNAIGVI